MRPIPRHAIEPVRSPRRSSVEHGAQRIPFQSLRVPEPFLLRAGCEFEPTPGNASFRRRSGDEKSLTRHSASAHQTGETAERPVLYSFGLTR